VSDNQPPKPEVKARQEIAAERNAGLRKVVAEVMEKTGLTKLAEIVEALNPRGLRNSVPTPPLAEHIANGKIRCRS
jgi:hypothetical protein